MKLLALFLLTSTYLFSTSFWTLSGVTKANIYVTNKIDYLKQDTITKAKEKMTATLIENGIQTDAQDAPTLMLELANIQEDETHYVYLQLALGEEVKTYRVDKTETFALTYHTTDFIDVDESDLDSDILESVDFLLAKFTEQFEDDKEE